MAKAFDGKMRREGHLWFTVKGINMLENSGALRNQFELCSDIRCFYRVPKAMPVL